MLRILQDLQIHSRGGADGDGDGEPWKGEPAHNFKPVAPAVMSDCIERDRLEKNKW